MSAPILVPNDVRALALEGRVRPAPTYHARQHHVSFAEIMTALSYCNRVVPDSRLDERGGPTHPNGHIAWGRTRTVELRSDLERQTDEEGDLLLVVTAMEVTR